MARAGKKKRVAAAKPSQYTGYFEIAYPPGVPSTLPTRIEAFAHRSVETLPKDVREHARYIAYRDETGTRILKNAYGHVTGDGLTEEDLKLVQSIVKADRAEIKSIPVEIGTTFASARGPLTVALRLLVKRMMFERTEGAEDRFSAFERKIENRFASIDTACAYANAEAVSALEKRLEHLESMAAPKPSPIDDLLSRFEEVVNTPLVAQVKELKSKVREETERADRLAQWRESETKAGRAVIDELRDLEMQSRRRITLLVAALHEMDVAFRTFDNIGLNVQQAAALKRCAEVLGTAPVTREVGDAWLICRYCGQFVNERDALEPGLSAGHPKTCSHWPKPPEPT